MKKSLIIIAFSLVFSLNAHTAENLSKNKKDLIDILLEQTGQSSIEIGKQFSDLFVQQMTMLLKQSKPDIDPRAFDILENEITSIINEEMVIKDTFKEMMYPIYAKHFTEADLKQMIELNNTEFGKKIIKVMPTITQEGMQAGQQMGQSLGPKIQQRIMERFQQEGIQ